MIRSHQIIYIIHCLSLLIVAACKHNPKYVFDEKDYTLVKIDSFEGKLDKANYVYKYDSSRKMQINYFFDGKILAKGFMYKNQLDGPLYTYSYSGEIQSKTVFQNGKEISKERFYKIDTSMRLMRDGKIYAPDSNGNFHKTDN